MHRISLLNCSGGWKLTFAAVVSAMLLSACGGGGASPSVASAAVVPATSAGTGSVGSSSGTTAPARSTSPAPAPAPAPQLAAIDYYGDSTIWGYESGIGTRAPEPAPAAFAAALPQYGMATQYTVRNEGVVATTGCELLNGTDGVHPVWTTQMTASDAAVVIINHGINDLAYETADQYASCLTQLSQIARAHGKKVIFETPNPTLDKGLDTFVGVMKTVAAQEGDDVIDQYQMLMDYLAGGPIVNICPDGTHPTDDIYRMKGEYAARIFAGLKS